MDKFILIIWDVQHGSAAYVRTPNGKNVVIDLGTGDATGGDEYFSPLLQLKSWGVNMIDLLILTHPHRDHIDDILNIDEVKVGSVFRVKSLSETNIRSANRGSDKEKIDNYIEFVSRYTLDRTSSARLPENNGGVHIQSFLPFNVAQSEINNNSIVTVFEYLGIKIIVPGDNEAASWKALLSNPEFVQAIAGNGILVASHHGRESGYYSDIFDYFTPYVTIISDGPESKTSVTPNYYYHSAGWEVVSRGRGDTEDRYCVTTRKDGTIITYIYKSGRDIFIDISRE